MKSGLSWIPTLSIKIGYIHFWLGSDFLDGRKVYGVIERKEIFTIGFTLYWLSDETPMFSLILKPFWVATIFWCCNRKLEGV